MSKSGPIIIIDDDKKEQLLYQVALKNLRVPNTIHFFNDGKEALDYLETPKEDPFLIISDIDMPNMNGLELRQRIAANPYLKKKSTPFVFITTGPTNVEVKEAYELAVQGFFKKPYIGDRLEQQLMLLIDYWTECIEPNNFN